MVAGEEWMAGRYRMANEASGVLREPSTVEEGQLT